MGAVISDCGKYRYVLTRDVPQIVRWVRPMLFIMLNPSKADAETDDNTIRKCIKFANRELCTKLTVVNLFALRATDPTELLDCDYPVGPDNIKHIRNQIDEHRSVGTIVAAWGNNKATKKALGTINYIQDFGYDIYCLGQNQDGSPKHPLYRPDATKFDLWWPGAKGEV